MNLLSWVCNFPTTNLYGLMHIWLLGGPHQIIPPFSMFHDGRELYHFSRGRNKHNCMQNIMKFLEISDNVGCGRDI